MHDTRHNYQSDKSIDKSERQINVKCEKPLKSFLASICQIKDDPGNESFTIFLTDLWNFQ